MNYELVTLKEKTVVGLSARTSNQDPEMSTVIGGLWQRFYTEVFPALPQNAAGCGIGLYTDYASDETGSYTAFAGCAVEPGTVVPPGTRTITIPAGTYAKFTVQGDIKNAVAAFWQELWQMDLNRSFLCDFEEYKSGSQDNAAIDIYIGLTA